METSSPIKTLLPVKQKSAKLDGLATGVASFELEQKDATKGLSCGQNSYNRKASEDSTQASTSPPEIKYPNASEATKIMYDRYFRSNENLPDVDKSDVSEECPLFNKGLKSCPEHQ